MLLFRRLDPAPRESATGRYRLIGRGSEWFAIKLIDRRPDFDHILRLDAPLVRGEATVALQGLARPGEAVQQASKARGLVDLYFETDDLR